MSQIICRETGKVLAGEFFIASRQKDNGICFPLSEEAVLAVPDDKKSKERKGYTSGGFDISKARIGEDGSIQSHPENDYVFSVSAIDGLDLFRNTSEEFPCKVPPHKGENCKPPIEMGVPIT
ncbi:MAG: hypothetical protein WC763_02755 [Candidatus Paceibacterota bacterium]|jgi:hypothetical protein